MLFFLRLFPIFLQILLFLPSPFSSFAIAALPDFARTVRAFLTLRDRVFL